VTGEKLKWTRSQKFYRLHYDGKMQEAAELDLQGFRLHQDVEAHTKRVPCLTTPAPTESGRAPPKKLKGRVDPAQEVSLAGRRAHIRPMAIRSRSHAPLTRWLHDYPRG